MYEEDQNGMVRITLSRDDYMTLLLSLGIAAGCLLRDGDRPGFNRALALANRINQGNPNFRPYEIP